MSDKPISRNQELANVFSAAAQGAMAPYMRAGRSYSSASYDASASLAGSMRAISAMYQKLADAEANL